MRNCYRIIILFLLIKCSVLSLTGCNANTNANTKQQEISGFEFPELNNDIAQLLTEDSSAVERFYRENGYTPIWIDKEPKFQKINDVLAILNESYVHGLNPEHFNSTLIKQITDSVSNEVYEWEDYIKTVLKLELILSNAAIKYSTAMQFGNINPKILFPNEYHIDIKQPDSLYYSKLFNDLKTDPVKLLVSAQPSDEAYTQLQQSLLKWKTLRDSTFVKMVDKGKNQVYKLNDKDKTFKLIANRLSISGEYLLSDTIENDQLTAELIEAVNHFRKINSYPESTEIDKITIDALNRPFDYYYRKTLANLERYRWKRTIQTSAKKTVDVNIAGAYLIASEESADPLIMNVCVGKSSSRTPLMQNNISYLNLNPYWNVPKSIAQDEICLIMKRDSTYLRRHNMRVYNGTEEIDQSTIDWKTINCKRFYYTIKQDPGNGNSLGRIKFMFPNKFAVYLHDTPSKLTFKRKNRAVSHGCVRVEKPIDLAFFCTSATTPVYQDRIRYTIERNPITKEGKDLLKKEALTKLPDIINLKERIPVSIDYHTAYMLPNDSVLYFADDVYGYDEIIVKRLEELMGNQ